MFGRELWTKINNVLPEYEKARPSLGSKSAVFFDDGRLDGHLKLVTKLLLETLLKD